MLVARNVWQMRVRTVLLALCQSSECISKDRVTINIDVVEPSVACFVAM